MFTSMQPQVYFKTSLSGEIFITNSTLILFDASVCSDMRV